MIDALTRFFGTLPSTNFRICVTLFLVVLTAARYLASGLGLSSHGLHLDPWTPSGEWLLFLAAMAGIDVAQFTAKRTTMKESPPAQPDVEDQPAAAQKGMK